MKFGAIRVSSAVVFVMTSLLVYVETDEIPFLFPPFPFPPFLSLHVFLPLPSPSPFLK